MTQSELFAVGILSILSAAGKMEAVRITGGLRSIQRYLPLNAVVIDSEAMEKVNLRQLLSLPEVPGLRVLCVELRANRAAVYDRGTAEFTQAGDLVDLLLSQTGSPNGKRQRDGEHT